MKWLATVAEAVAVATEEVAEGVEVDAEGTVGPMQHPWVADDVGKGGMNLDNRSS